MGGVGDARVVVGLDFGTTFSGFAYAHKAEPSKVFTFYEWPEQANGGGQPYCKTQTSLFYAEDESGNLKLKDWGWPALVNYKKALSTLSRSKRLAPTQPLKVGKLVTKFKLHLAECISQEPLSAEALPDGLTTEIVITDYLREISKFIILHLKSRFGKHFGMHEVQWCLTVPAIWSDHAKQLMKSYAEEAGLLQRSGHAIGDASPHPLLIILEPEAAAVYCLQKLKFLSFEIQDKFLTADVGGGTVDIVIHEKLQRCEDTNLEQLKELTRSTGDLCGGTYVDIKFVHHLSKRIGCLQSFLEENPSMLLSILRWWEGVKSTFMGRSTATFDTPSILVRAWEIYDLEQQAAALCNMKSECGSYDEIEFSVKDLLSIFDPVVEQIFRLIKVALNRFAFGEVKAIFAVGGFSASPYLMERMREEFKGLVKEVVSPPDPGSAVCQGAAMLGIAKHDIIVSRICRRTYGTNGRMDFEKGDLDIYRVIDDDGIEKCNNRFSVFVTNGDEVPVNHAVSRIFHPTEHFQKSVTIGIYSSGKSVPRYTLEEGVVKEGSFNMDISAGMKLDKSRQIAVTMFFGRSSIEVTAKGVNFSASGGAKEAISLKFNRSSRQVE